MLFKFLCHKLITMTKKKNNMRWSIYGDTESAAVLFFPCSGVKWYQQITPSIWSQPSHTHVMFNFSIIIFVFCSRHVVYVCVFLSLSLSLSFGMCASVYGKSEMEMHSKTWSQDKISWKRDRDDNKNPRIVEQIELTKRKPVSCSW